MVFKRLSVRLALWMVLATFIMQGLHAVYRISVDIPKAKNAGIEEVNKVVTSLKPALSESLYQFNEDLSEQLLKTFISYPAVYQVELLDEDKMVAHHWLRDSEFILEPDYVSEVNLSYEGAAIGFIRISINFHPIITQAQNDISNSIWFSLTMGIASLILLYFVAQSQVTAPISKLSSAVEGFDTSAFKKSDVVMLDSIKADAEVETLRNSVKTILLELADNLDENKRANDQLKGFTGQLEEKVKQRTEELAISTERAEKANQAKTDFMNTMTHELRTPLNSIMGFSSILKGQELPERLAKLVDNVHGSGGQLLQLINDIIDYVDLETKPLVSQVFSVFDVINAINNECNKYAVSRSLKLTMDVDESLILVGDPKRLNMVVRHLVNNAIKFTEKGRINISAYKDDEYSCCIAIKDTGPGIDLTRISDLSESFVQLEQGLDRKNEGVGLGLAIVVRVCRKWGADIQFTHVSPHGTEVTIRLPNLESSVKFKN